MGFPRHIVLHYSGYRYGGIERVIALQVPILRQLGCGVSLLIDGVPPPPESHVPTDCEIVLLSPEGIGADPVRRAARQEKLVNHLVRTKADVYYEHSYRQAYDGSTAADLQAARCRGLRVVCHWHNSFSRYLEFEGDPIENFKRMNELVDVVVCLSRVDAAFFRMRGFCAVYIPNPCDPDIMARMFTGRATGGHQIVWCGRFSSIKNPLGAVRIVGLVRREIPDARLLLIGAPDGITEARLQAEANRVGADVRFAGQVRDVYSLYAGADVFLSTAEVEGFPMVILEAMASGLPVVCYDLPYLEVLRQAPSVRRIRQHDEVSAARALVDLLSDRRVFQEASTASRTAAERFAAFDQASAYAALLNDCCPVDPPSAEDLRLVWDELDAARRRRIRALARESASYLRIGLLNRIFGWTARIARKLSLLLPGRLGRLFGGMAKSCYDAVRFGNWVLEKRR